MTMKILVTGGCGFIGSHLTDSYRKVVVSRVNIPAKLSVF